MEEKLMWLFFAKNLKIKELKKAFKEGKSISEAYLEYGKSENLEEIKEYYEKECLGKGIEFISRDEAGFPYSLLQIPDAPFWLFFMGSLPKDGEKNIAVVGARGCSAYGSEYARKISSDLAGRGVNIISGMAAGIDAKAHRGAINAGGKTFAVLGCGVDICYPKENFDIYNLIPKCGGILSEYPPGSKPLSMYFPMRNRIISGLSDGVFVAEAREKSGSLITAGLGLEHGKNIYALPGRADDPMSKGCNMLIREGAKLVLSASDILEDFDFFSGMNMAFPVASKIILETTEKIVYSTLRFEPRHINSITDETGLDESEARKALLMLCIKGCAREITTDYYIATDI